MKLPKGAELWFRPAAYLGNNFISILGAVITTSSALTLIGFWAIDLMGGGNVHPYIGVLLFLILPGVSRSLKPASLSFPNR